MIWYLNENPEIVISTRVRLARNLSGVPFPNKLKNKKDVIKKIKDAIFLSNSTLASDFFDVGLENMSDSDKACLMEKHLISRQMLKDGTACLINKDETMSIMVMEEDHIREQVILGGYHPDEAYEICNKVDDVLSENLDFAYDEKIGYLTSCPTNVGTGLRISVMLHLPGLTMTDRINRVVSSAANIGIAIRGYNGEGTMAEGAFYQISNQVTLGVSEAEIISRVKNVTEQIIALENESRKLLLDNNKAWLEDRIWRSYGVLKFARKINSKEAISCLSDVLLGVNSGIITNDEKIPVMELIVKTQPANIDSGNSTPVERDWNRAEYIRKYF